MTGDIKLNLSIKKDQPVKLIAVIPEMTSPPLRSTLGLTTSAKMPQTNLLIVYAID
jgi:hypothetical protein